MKKKIKLLRFICCSFFLSFCILLCSTRKNELPEEKKLKITDAFDHLQHQKFRWRVCLWNCLLFFPHFLSLPLIFLWFFSLSIKKKSRKTITKQARIFFRRKLWQLTIFELEKRFIQKKTAKRLIYNVNRKSIHIADFFYHTKSIESILLQSSLAPQNLSISKSSYHDAFCNRLSNVYFL